jgi:YhfZ C-terminal domain/Helix-turn-helix domain
MQEEFLQKTGKAIEVLAAEILLLNQGDKLPVISEFVERSTFSRGTVQNALQFLKDRQAIITKSKGHLGTFIIDIDYRKLQSFILKGYLRASMPLPYSKTYEGFASGVYENFSNVDIPLSMAYMRGAKQRILQVEQGVYHFSIVSALAAKVAKEEGHNIDVLLDFGSGSYLSEHVLLLADSHQSLVDGMRIGIDDASYDQQYLTHELTKDRNLLLVPVAAHQLVSHLQRGLLDAGIWNYDQVKGQHYPGIHYQCLQSCSTTLSSSAALIGSAQNKVINAILTKNLNKESILAVQAAVIAGLRSPQY